MMLLDQKLKSRDQLSIMLRENLQKVQQMMKLSADKRMTEMSFEIGDWIFFGLQPYRQKPVSMRHNLKLSPKFYGPFRKIEKIGSVT